jgi:hypothetical protein
MGSRDLSKMVRDSHVREALLPQMSDDRFAVIVEELDDKAARSFVAFNGWDSNHWQDPEVRSFLGRFSNPAP